ncbi:MAG: hypothetical protein JW779_09665 [Candidatus Thorarchaeota archaeon]|nr:hypothetical protein [Candidatus Thorarchaeota archaeon]
MSETNYNDILTAWEDEVENESLQDLQDLRLGKMISYLSDVRLKLASTSAEELIQADLLTQEALNLEFMLEDLLKLRRDKILKSALGGRRPTGYMTVIEDEFYSRIQRALDNHSEFVKESLAGSISSQKRKKSKNETISEVETDESLSNDSMEYYIVRFLRPVDDAFMGLDEIIYGPFLKEDIAKIPAANARTWLRDGTVVRTVIEEGAPIDDR